MVELRKQMKWIVIGAIAMTMAAVWYLSLFTQLTVPVVAATIAGVFLSVVLGCGLFAAAFFSNNSGMDQAVGGVVQPDPGRLANPIALPDNLVPYKHTDMFTETTVPAGLLRDHNTKEGVWGLIRVDDGCLRYRVTDPRRAPFETILSPADPPGIVEPTILHHVEALGSVRFQVEFLRRPDPKAVLTPDSRRQRHANIRQGGGAALHS